MQLLFTAKKENPRSYHQAEHGGHERQCRRDAHSLGTGTFDYALEVSEDESP